MIPRPIRGLLRLALLGFGIGWVIDRVLRRTDGDGAPTPISSLIVIDAPIERVWAEVADIVGQPRWMVEMKSVRLLTKPPIRVGTRGEATVRVFGISVTDPVEVTEFVPPHRFAIRHEGSFSGGGLITLAAGADGTTTILRWDETLVAPILPHLAARVQARVFERIFQADLERLRSICEA